MAEQLRGSGLNDEQTAHKLAYPQTSTESKVMPDTDAHTPSHHQQEQFYDTEQPTYDSPATTNHVAVGHQQQTGGETYEGSHSSSGTTAHSSGDNATHATHVPTHADTGAPVASEYHSNTTTTSSSPATVQPHAAVGEPEHHSSTTTATPVVHETTHVVHESETTHGTEQDDEAEDDNAHETVVHTQRNNAEALAIKLKETDVVREFEARRSHYYKSQYANHISYWQALCDLMKGNEAATSDLLDYYQHRTKAYRTFADSLFSLNDGVSGDKSGATRKLAHEDKLFSSRAVKLQEKHAKKGSAKPLGAAGAQTGDGHLLDEICGMDCDIAREIDNFAASLEGGVGAKLQAMHEECKTEATKCFKEGDQAFETLANVDLYTLKTYETRHRVSAENMIKPTEYMGEHGHSKKNIVGEETPDVWLSDMNYRVAVKQQAEAWGNISGILARLFDRLRDTEIKRRTITQSVLQSTLADQKALWGRLPTFHAGPLASLEKFDLNPTHLEKSIKDEVRITASQPRDAETTLPIPDEETLRSDTVPRATDAAFTDDLAAPLTSPYVVHAAVIERKEKKAGLTFTWVPCLAVLTNDLFMHLFDCPKVHPGTDIQTAFDAVLPSIEVADKFRANKEEKRAMVTPSMSLDLTDHIVGPRGKQTKPEHAAQFHVVEVKQNTGFKSMFKNESQHKASLKASSEIYMQEWVNKIKQLASNSLPMSA